MHRRRLLAAMGALTAALAGCASSGQQPETTSDDTSTTNRSGTSDNRTNSEPNQMPLSLTVEGTDDVPVEADIAVEVIQQASEDHPAKIRVSYANTADAQREVRFENSPPFSSYTSEGDRPRLVVIPDDHYGLAPAESTQLVPDAPVDGCWQNPAGFAAYGAAHTRTLAPDETVAEEYTVLADHRNDGCLPAGAYRFEQEHYFGHERPWGFSLALSE